MAQVDINSKVGAIGKGDQMKRLNDYFFEGQGTISDFIWFFGPLLFGIILTVFLYIHTH